MAFSRGTLRPIRSILGAILMVAAAGSLLSINTITSLVAQYSTVFNVIVGISGYLLFRQYYNK